MDLSNFRSLLALAAITFTLALNAPSGRADQIIDNFEDGNYVAETYGNNPNGLTEWYGDIATKILGAGLGVRTRSNSAILNSSNKDAATSGVPGSRHYQFGTGANSGITASDHAVVASRAQSLSLNLYRKFLTGGLFQAITIANDNFTTCAFVRVTAWRISAVPTSAVFTVNLTNPPTGTFLSVVIPNMSCGPWDATGTNLTGLALTTTPTVYIVPIKSSARFKVDPGYASATGKGSITDFTKIAAIQFGYRRSGAVAGSGIMDAKFAIDDVIIMSKLPGVSGSAPAPFPESGATGSTFPVVLDAIPSHPVTFVPAVSNPSAFTISPASMTFTSANWDTTQTFSVQAVAANDDPIREPDTTSSVAFTVVTNDLAYMQITQAPLTVRIADDDPTATLGFAPATASALETDGALTVTVALSAPSLTTVTATLSADIPAGTATAGDDFDFTTASLVFAPGATTATTTINVLNDATNEQPETAVLTLTDLSGADSGATTYTLTITSDEVPVAVSRFGLD